MAVLIPELLWAQRKDVLYLTIDLQDCDPEPVVTVTNADGHGKLEFKGSAGGHTYETTVNLFSEVKPEDALIAITPRHIFVKLPKAVDDADHWPRLTDEKVKNGHIKVRLLPSLIDSKLRRARLTSRTACCAGCRQPWPCVAGKHPACVCSCYSGAAR